MKTPRWWISWYQPPDLKAGWDYRASKWPHDAALLGSWESGFTDTHMTVCALIEAKTEDDARRLVKDHWPEFPGGGERFCEEQVPGWTPGDRFPMSVSP